MCLYGSASISLSHTKLVFHFVDIAEAVETRPRPISDDPSQTRPPRLLGQVRRLRHLSDGRCAIGRRVTADGELLLDEQGDGLSRGVDAQPGCRRRIAVGDAPHISVVNRKECAGRSARRYQNRSAVPVFAGNAGANLVTRRIHERHARIARNGARHGRVVAEQQVVVDGAGRRARGRQRSG